MIVSISYLLLYKILDNNKLLFINTYHYTAKGRTNQLQSVIYFHTLQMTKAVLDMLPQLNTSYTHLQLALIYHLLIHII